MGLGATSFSLRIIDKSNYAVIKESTFTNATETENYLTDLTDLPFNSSELEVHVKVVGNGSVHISLVNIYV